MTAIPVIDLAHARASESNRKSIAAQIDRANREVGFLTVINHGIETDLLSDVLSVTHAFFDLPEPAKNAYIGDPASSRGYIAPRARALAGTRGVMTPGDLVELFAMGMPHVPDEPYFDISNSGNNFHPNIWPAEIPGMERIWTAYYQRVAALAREIMSLFAEALDLEPDFFEDKIDKPISNLFANCYPPITTEPLPGQLRGRRTHRLRDTHPIVPARRGRRTRGSGERVLVPRPGHRGCVRGEHRRSHGALDE